MSNIRNLSQINCGRFKTIPSRSLPTYEPKYVHCVLSAFRFGSVYHSEWIFFSNRLNLSYALSFHRNGGSKTDCLHAISTGFF